MSQTIVSSASELSTMQRIVVVGISGAGKSTLAKALSDRNRLPYVPLDELFWGPQWQPKPAPVFAGLVQQAVDGERWVVDGNYATVRQHIWPTAQAVIWLNVSLPVTLWRVLRRTVWRILARERLWHDNRESIGRALSKESLLLWVWENHKRRREEFGRLRADKAYPHLVWFEFKSPSEVRTFLRALKPVT